MKTISCWDDLRPFGLVPLTGEACGLGYRLLCDVTTSGKHILEKCFGLQTLGLTENWNRGSSDHPHIGSILLPYDCLVPVAVFALLEHGCTEVWLYRDQRLRGIEPTDPADQVVLWRQSAAADQLVRTFAYRGTAGDRNVHCMSGRIE